jgi:hypothetical protein
MKRVMAEIIKTRTKKRQGRSEMKRSDGTISFTFTTSIYSFDFGTISYNPLKFLKYEKYFRETWHFFSQMSTFLVMYISGMCQ